jgi:hypothetical protein
VILRAGPCRRDTPLELVAVFTNAPSGYPIKALRCIVFL